MPNVTETDNSGAQTTAPAAPPTTGDAPPPRWDLGDLYAGPDDPALAATLDGVKRDAEAFADRYRGRLADLTPAALADALAEYETIRQEAAKPDVYAGLRFAADTSAEVGAFYQKVRERVTEATLPLVFFGVELSRIPGERLDALAQAPELAPLAHYLATVRDNARYRLSEPEEKILETQANTGRRAFVRLFEEITSNLAVPVPGRPAPVTLSQALDLQSDPDRAVRRASAQAITDALEPQQRTLAFIYNALMQNKADEDRLRGLTHPEQGRHLLNELSAETVETVVRASENGYPLVARYYAAKRRLLGLPELSHYDRYAPLFADETHLPYDAARGLILSAFGGFDAAYADEAAAFFENGWVDAAPATGKRGGAFCSSVTPDRHPYLFVNYLGKMGDVRTLAHELGHGIHGSLARAQRYLNFYGTLPMAEVASTFAEQLVFEAQVRECDDRTRLAAYAEQIEGCISTVFRQTTLYRFEQAAHRERRENGELAPARFAELWLETNRAMFGDALALEEGYGVWWSYIRHFIASPFYVYAYTFGEMLALALYARYRAEGAPFVPRYREMLASGGSRSPRDLVAPLGVDLEDPAFWQGATALIGEQVAAFERLAAASGS